MSTNVGVWRLAFAVGALAVLFASPVCGAATLKGQLLRNRIGGSPVAGAAVAAEGASPTASTSLGAFTLEFPNKKPGERVGLTISVPGMTVVNWVQLDVVLPADAGGMNVLTLLLAREIDREEMAAEFFRLRSTRAIEQQYQQRLQEAGQDKARLLRELEQAKALAKQTAQELAKVQPGQSSPLYEEAMRLVAEGRLDEALRTLDEAKLKARAQTAKRQLRETARDWALRGSLLATQFRFAEAEAAYRSAVETVPEDFDRRFEFALFLQRLNRYGPARDQYERCLELARSHSDAQRVSTTLNNLANLHRDQNRMEEAGKAYQEALAICRKLVASNRDTYLPDLAMTLNNLANLYSVQNRMEEARKTYNEALASYRKLAASNPDIYLPDVAMTLNNLGNLHSAQNRMEEAREAYEGALAIRRKLAASNPDIYLSYLANTLNSLGNLHSAQTRMDEARIAFDEALANFRKLAASNPDTYLPYVATTLNNLGVLNGTQSRTEEARRVFEEALESYRKLAASNPNTYLADISMTLTNLGVLHRDQGRIEESRKAFAEALAGYRELADSNPDTYLPFVARALWGIGPMHMATGNRDEARKTLAEALHIYSRFTERDPEQYGRFLRIVQEALAEAKQ